MLDELVGNTHYLDIGTVSMSRHILRNSSSQTTLDGSVLKSNNIFEVFANLAQDFFS